MNSGKQNNEICTFPVIEEADNSQKKIVNKRVYTPW